MRALLAAVGTRGDVQPALALALELRTLGHAVRMCVSPNFVDWAKSLGFEAVPMGIEMRLPGRRVDVVDDAADCLPVARHAMLARDRPESSAARPIRM